MNLFYHHVGKVGAEEDFKKTVFLKRQIKEIEASLPNNFANKPSLIKNLKSCFPNGNFNCWGVPAGAKTVIKNLKVGDEVLLVESAHITGQIPILGKVKHFEPVEMRILSEKLWGNEKFPFIFFFDTEPLNLNWIEFFRTYELCPKL